MLVVSNQVSLPKISSMLQKRKSAKNSIYALFAQSPSIAIITNFIMKLSVDVLF